MAPFSWLDDILNPKFKILPVNTDLPGCNYVAYTLYLDEALTRIMTGSPSIPTTLI